MAIGEELRRLPGLTISGVLTADEVSAASEQCGLRFRLRLFSPFVTLWLFVWQAISPDGSCREAVLRLLADRPLNYRGEAIIATTGCYCRAQKNLHLVVNNARFLILPWVGSKNLASKLLGLVARQLPEDWQHRYGYRPLLLETFVEQARFTGACYRAANWLHVGQTRGRGKLGPAGKQSVPIQ